MSTTERYSLRVDIPQEDGEALRGLAEEDDCTVSRIVRLAIRRFIEAAA